MANADIEKTLKKITDTQLVIVRLMETHERKWERRFETAEARLEGSERRTKDLEQGAAHILRAIEKLWTVAAAHDQRTENLRRIAETHERRLEDSAEGTAALRDEVRTMVAAVDRLIKTMEDLARGRKRENGRRR